MGEGHVAAGGIAAAARGAWLVFEDEAVFSMTQLTRRTWARRGRTPVVRVPGRPSTTSAAAVACYRRGQRSRLIYRPRPDDRRDGRKSFDGKDHRDLPQAAHEQLDGPIAGHRDASLQRGARLADGPAPPSPIRPTSSAPSSEGCERSSPTAK